MLVPKLRCVKCDQYVARDLMTVDKKTGVYRCKEKCNGSQQ